MVRRSKQDALATREALLDAAQGEFAVHGVAGTSLEKIAAAAGVTRGAVYWHFRDKNDLFEALMARAKLPLEQMWQAMDADTASLPALQASLLQGLRLIASDARLQQVLLIATQKVEYVGEQETLRERHLAARQQFLSRIEQVLKRVQAAAPLSLPPKTGAIALHALLGGLAYEWMLCERGFDLVAVGTPAIKAFIAALPGPAEAATGRHAPRPAAKPAATAKAQSKAKAATGTVKAKRAMAAPARRAG
jgi:TetR/AcrR family acrAB operon transcriptional repressor